MLFFAQCPYDKVLGASNLPMLRYEWVWYKSRCTGFLNARRAPLKKTENILVFYQKLPLYNPQFEQGKPYKKIAGNRGDSTNYGKFLPLRQRIGGRPALSRKCAGLSHRPAYYPPHAKASGAVRVFHQDLYPARRGGGGHLRWLRHNGGGRPQHKPPLYLF